MTMIDALAQEIFTRLVLGGGIPQWLRDLWITALDRECR
jgi:hypothetical protein